jgi:tetratricopeptide (TPR) repeat protein
MAKKKRVTRKQLLKEPDEFLTFSAKAIRFGAENQKAISYALIALVVAVLSVALFRYFSNLSERKAYAVFEQGLNHYMGQTSGKTSAHFKDQAKEAFAEVLRKYPSTRAAELSLPLYADVSYEAGAYDQAIELYQRALKALSSEDKTLKRLIWNNLAYAYEGKKDYNTAAQYYEKITGAEGAFLKADAYFNLGRVYEAMGHQERARKAYDHLVKDYPGAVNFQVAKEKLGRLEGQG